MLCSVEERAQCRAWGGAVPGWIAPQSSGRKFLPEICVKKGQFIRDRKGTPKNLYDKDFAELSGKLSGPIGLKPLDLLGSALELFRKVFGTVRAIFLLALGFFCGP